VEAVKNTSIVVENKNFRKCESFFLYISLKISVAHDIIKIGDCMETKEIKRQLEIYKLKIDELWRIL